MSGIGATAPCQVSANFRAAMRGQFTVGQCLNLGVDDLASKGITNRGPCSDYQVTPTRPARIGKDQVSGL